MTSLQTESAAWPLVDGLYRSPALTALGLVAGLTTAALGSMGGSVFPQEEQAASRDAVAKRLGFPAVVRVKQVHGARVLRADGPFASPWPEADGLWTDRPGVLLGVSAADCAPVLIADGDGRIGAAHAGWEGTTRRVVQALVSQLVAAGARPDRLVAAIGPAIGPCCYTIGEERNALIRERLGEGPWLRGGSSASEAPGVGAPGREATWVFDVPGANAAQLADAGVGTIELSDRCTRCGGADLWSYRSRGERGSQGTGAALIGRPG